MGRGEGVLQYVRTHRQHAGTVGLRPYGGASTRGPGRVEAVYDPAG